MVTPRRHDLNEQLTCFKAFTGLAHRLGATQVRTADATLGEDGEGVVLRFSHGRFPNVRFGYRAKPPGEDDDEELWLAEELATGALDRIMSDSPPPTDPAGVTWLRLDGQVLRGDL